MLIARLGAVVRRPIECSELGHSTKHTRRVARLVDDGRQLALGELQHDQPSAALN
jgi:hypothetical protein